MIMWYSCDSNSNDTIVYIVRHAEKDLVDTTDNPPLIQAGIDRSKALVKEMNAIEIDGVFSTYYDRNLNTVSPLAKERGLFITNYEWYGYQSMLDDIKNNSGKVYLICGHGDNILPMIEYLGGERPMEFLEKQEYDKLFKVIISEKEVKVEVNTY